MGEWVVGRWWVVRGVGGGFSELGNDLIVMVRVGF